MVPVCLALIAGIGAGLIASGCVSERDPAVDRGRQLVAQYQCGACHQVPGVPAARGTLGPSLAHVGRASYVAGHLPTDATTLARFIASPQALVPGSPMPDMGASDDDARDIAAYLRSLR